MSQIVYVAFDRGGRHRFTFKPDTAMFQVLEEACKKRRFDPNHYELRFKGRPLDLACTIRYSNVPNNGEIWLTKLENMRREEPVNVNVQLEDGTRVNKEFSPNCSLRDVLMETCPKEIHEQKSITLIYARKEIAEDGLSSTTLKSLGLTCGTALFRIRTNKQEAFTPLIKLKNVERKTDIQELRDDLRVEYGIKPSKAQKTSDLENGNELNKSLSLPIEESNLCCNNFSSPMDYSSVPIHDVEMEDVSDFYTTEPISTNRASDDMDMEIEKESYNTGKNAVECKSKSNYKQEEVKEVGHKRNAGSEVHDIDLQNFKYMGPKQAVLFSLDEVTSEDTIDPSDDFFEHTTEDIKLLHKRLAETRRALTEREMLTDTIRRCKIAEQREKNLDLYPRCVLRIQFPDRHVLQGVFECTETPQSLYDFTKTFLQDPTMDFHLFTSPPKTTVVSSDVPFNELGFLSGINLYFGTQAENSNGSFLKKELYSQCVKPAIANAISKYYRDYGVKIVS